MKTRPILTPEKPKDISRIFDTTEPLLRLRDMGDDEFERVVGEFLGLSVYPENIGYTGDFPCYAFLPNSYLERIFKKLPVLNKRNKTLFQRFPE